MTSPNIVYIDISCFNDYIVPTTVVAYKKAFQKALPPGSVIKDVIAKGHIERQAKTTRGDLAFDKHGNPKMVFVETVGIRVDVFVAGFKKPIIVRLETKESQGSCLQWRMHLEALRIASLKFEQMRFKEEQKKLKEQQSGKQDGLPDFEILHMPTDDLNDMSSATAAAEQKKKLTPEEQAAAEEAELEALLAQQEKGMKKTMSKAAKKAKEEAEAAALAAKQKAKPVDDSSSQDWYSREEYDYNYYSDDDDYY